MGERIIYIDLGGFLVWLTWRPVLLGDMSDTGWYGRPKLTSDEVAAWILRAVLAPFLLGGIALIVLSLGGLLSGL